MGSICKGYLSDYILDPAEVFADLPEDLDIDQLSYDPENQYFYFADKLVGIYKENRKSTGDFLTYNVKEVHTSPTLHREKLVDYVTRNTYNKP